MKLVTAIIKPFKLEDVRDALTKIGVAGSRSPRSRASAARRATPRSIAGAEYTVNFLPKIKIEVVVPDRPRDARGRGDRHRRPRPGRSATARFSSVEVEHALRIRTGETDSDAL
jgi:nitrogen regulatory protein PII